MTTIARRVGRWLTVVDGVDLVAAERRPFSGRPLPRVERIVVATFVGALTVYLAYIALGNRMYGAKDWTYQWRAGQALLAGLNPYDAVRPIGGYPYESWYMYPFTAVLATLPFATLAIRLGGALFVAFGAAMLAYAVSRHGIGRLWIFAGAPFYLTIILGQWAPLLMAGALLTPLAFVLTCKPTLGAALFAYRPSWRTALIGAAFGMVALLVHPAWIQEWFRNAGRVEGHGAPVMHPFGWLPLLALLRWRRPEARLVGVMALVPQISFFYDQMPLLLVARSGRAAFAFAVLSWIGYALGMRDCGGGPTCAGPSQPWVLAFLYLPATLYVLADALTPDEVRRRLRQLRGRLSLAPNDRPGADAPTRSAPDAELV